jgi:hypothetical protein
VSSAGNSQVRNAAVTVTGRQNFVGSQPSAAAATPPPAQPAAAAPAQAQTEAAPQVFSPTAAVTSLQRAMLSSGLNPRAFNLSYSEEVVGYPGGSYVNRLITVESASGRKEQLMAELVFRNPQVAVMDIRRFAGAVV